MANMAVSIVECVWYLQNYPGVSKVNTKYCKWESYLRNRRRAMTEVYSVDYESLSTVCRHNHMYCTNH